MARTKLNVIKFAEYNQAIYPFDYYEEVAASTAGKLTVVTAINNADEEILWSDPDLIDVDGKALYDQAPSGNKYVKKVLGFFKPPTLAEGGTYGFEYDMYDRDEKYIIVARNTVKVHEYYTEDSQAEDKIEVITTGSTPGDSEIAWDDPALVGPDGIRLYSSQPSGTNYVLKQSGTKYLTIKKGDHIQSVEDAVYALRHNGTYYIVLESGRFKNVKQGDDKGKVILEASDAFIEAAVLKLR
jgi:sulfur carrier protein ThiS